MFYRYLSEHQEQYLVENNVLDVAAGESINKAYLEQAGGDDLNDYLEDTDENINRIIETYRNRVDVDKYAHVASLEEIKENEFNLNIPRYVDTFEEVETIDLDEVNRLLEQDKREIAELEAKINEQLRILGIDV